MKKEKMTPTEERIMEYLKCGEPKSKLDIKENCIEDQMCKIENVKVHISNLKKKLPENVIIVNEIININTVRYRMVRKM
jgi:DNA-binding response OmpR family regulator